MNPSTTDNTEPHRYEGTTPRPGASISTTHVLGLDDYNRLEGHTFAPQVDGHFRHAGRTEITAYRNIDNDGVPYWTIGFDAGPYVDTDAKVVVFLSVEQVRDLLAAIAEAR